MTRMLSTLALVPILSAILSAPVRGQMTTLPRTYSFLATTSLMSPEMQVKVNRTGAKELVELTLPAEEGQQNEMHQRLLYDFDAHRVYATDLTTNRCTVQEYGSTYAPMFDPIGSSEPMLAEMAASPPPVSRREVVNGIPTKLIEAPLAEGQGTSRLWVEEKRGFLVRLAVGMGKEPPTTRVEIRQLSYAPSPASLFVPPTGCTRIGGVATAEGGHAETSIEAEASATQRLETAEKSAVRAEPPDVTPPAEATPRAPTQLTSVRLRLVPEHYRGPCPGKIQLIGEFTTDGPGKVWYEFMAGAVSNSPEGTLTFTAAGTKTVTVQGAFNSEPQVPEAGLLGAMQNERGEHGPETVGSDPVQYDIKCTAR